MQCEVELILSIEELSVTPHLAAAVARWQLKL